MRIAGVIINYQEFKKPIQLTGHKTRVLQIKVKRCLMKLRKGFTIVELIITLAVLSIIVTIAGLNFNTYIINRNLESAARHIVSDFFLCRERAVSENTTYRINFDVDGHSYTIQPDTPAAVTKRLASFGPDIEIDSASFGNGQTVHFLTRGTVSPFGNIKLKNSRQSKATIKVNITGRTYVKVDAK
jgi:prepilin-type N-terminal cleavage/methylation domain-containing protein